MTPLERAARALQEAWDDGSDVASGLPPIEFTEPETFHLARAVLQAIREPSEGMIEAGNAIDGELFPEPVWQAMIDKALEEG